jgi:hypothetical protein
MVATYKLPVAMGDFCAAAICILAILIGLGCVISISRGESSEDSSLLETSGLLLFLVLLDFFELDFFFFFFFLLVVFSSSASSLESSVLGFFLFLPWFVLR